MPILFFCLLSLLILPLDAQAQWGRASPRLDGPAFSTQRPVWPVPPEISARAAVVMDAESGEVLFAQNPHRPLSPASTTKALTALLVLENLDLNAKVGVSRNATRVVPSKLGLEPGERLYVQDLLYGLMLKSGNDAALVAAEAVGGSVTGFSALMNRRARELGARHSRFRNPHGLTQDGHLSTAYDLAQIFRHALRDAVFAELVQTRNAALRVEWGLGADDWRLVRVHNSNRLLENYAGARGGKTGYTRRARLCFVGAAQRGRTRLVVSVLGSSSSARRWADVQNLLEYGFSLRGQPRLRPAATGAEAAALEVVGIGDTPPPME